MAVQLLSDNPVTLLGPPTTLVGPPSSLTPPPPITPFELTSSGHPISWAPTGPGPVQITIASGVFNYASDAGETPTFSNPLSPQDLNLLVAATHVWEQAANVHFNFVNDVPESSSLTPDVRVGLSDLNHGLAQGSMSFVGETDIIWDQNTAHFLPDVVTGIEDPAEHPVTALPDGDFAYNDTTGATMFQSMVHELGHALGLAHSPNDPHSIMNPVLSNQNRLPDAQDIAAVQQLYGAPTQGLQLSLGEQTTLQNLLVANT